MDPETTHTSVLPAPTADRTPRRLARFDRDGLRDIAPMVVGVAPFAAILGVTIGQLESVPAWAALLGAPLLYAGSAHLAALTLLESGAGAATVVAAAVVVNARLAVYGAALEPCFRDQPGWFRWLAPHFIVDQTYAIASTRPDLVQPARFRRYWLTAGLVLGAGWTAVMAAAVAAGPIVPVGPALTFASTAVFVGLLVPRLRERTALRPAAIAAVVALVAAPLPHGSGLLVATLAGVVPTLLHPRSTP
jgi:predicted branched-subunit amino acid permease